jgi:hypothetical protein
LPRKRSARELSAAASRATRTSRVPSRAKASATAAPIPLDAPEVLNREFLEVRAKILEIAAVLDRIDRAEGAVSIAVSYERRRCS